MKKLLACLLSLSMMSIAPLAASAVETDENGKVIGDIWAVVAVNERDGTYLLQGGCELYQGDIDDYAKEKFVPSVGDMIYVKASSIDPMAPGRYNFYTENNDYIEYLGTAEEYYHNTKELTVTRIDEDSVFLEDADHEQYKLVCCPYTDYTAEIDPAELNVGDVGLFVVHPEWSVNAYCGNVIVPLEITCKAEKESSHINPVETVTVKGDASGDGKTDILDVITVNKAILGKEKLTEAQLKAIDFNDNGKPDAGDSLAIMKQIVGLTETLA